MLILVAGATGKIGLNVVQSALKRGHQVRAIGRSPSKLPEDIRSQLESFVETSCFDDIKSLDTACRGVDAIVCAYGSDFVLLLDGQLALLRAAERAGVKRFHAASWNLDWSQMPLGTIETYDSVIAFARQAALTSPIKPLYLFCGVLPSTLFGAPGRGLDWESSVWKRNEDGSRTLQVVGDGNVTTPFAVEADAADFSVAMITGADAEKGGYYRFCSDEFTFNDLATLYEQVRGVNCSVKSMLDTATCRDMVRKARAAAEASDSYYSTWKKHTGLVYGLYFAEGTYNPKPLDAGKFPDVKQTTMKEFLENNAWI